MKILIPVLLLFSAPVLADNMRNDNGGDRNYHDRWSAEVNDRARERQRELQDEIRRQQDIDRQREIDSDDGYYYDYPD